MILFFTQQGVVLPVFEIPIAWELVARYVKRPDVTRLYICVQILSFITKTCGV